MPDTKGPGKGLSISPPTNLRRLPRSARSRSAADRLRGMGDVANKVVPKISLIAPAHHSGCVTTRSFIPSTGHTAIGVFAALSVAMDCLLPGSVAEGIAAVTATNSRWRGNLRPASLRSILTLAAANQLPSSGAAACCAQILCKGAAYRTRTISTN